jgi:hypothetical protein
VVSADAANRRDRDGGNQSEQPDSIRQFNSQVLHDNSSFGLEPALPMPLLKRRRIQFSPAVNETRRKSSVNSHLSEKQESSGLL